MRIDELSGKYYNDNVNDTYIFEIGGYIGNSSNGVYAVRAVIGADNSLDFSSVITPIYMLFQRSLVRHDRDSNRIYQEYTTTFAPEQRVELYTPNETEVGFVFDFNKNNSNMQFENFNFKGSVFTGDYVHE